MHVKRCGCTPPGGPDVGYLEIEPPVAAGLLGKEALPLDRMVGDGVLRKGHLAVVVGGPGERIVLRPEPLEIRSECIGYASLPIVAEDWTGRDFDGPTSSEIDMFLEYPKGPCLNVGKERVEKSPDPRGMSGGGVWDQGIDDDLWHPGRARLYGIQTAWHPGKGYLQAVQINQWLKLVRQDYPDLRSVL